MPESVVSDHGIAARTVTITSFRGNARVRYPKNGSVEIIPWIRTTQVETILLVADLYHDLGQWHGPVSPAWRTVLEGIQKKRCRLDYYHRDGSLIARYEKCLAPDEIWKVSTGTRSTSGLSYGLLLSHGRRTLSHFQMIGPRTFASCHSRRHRIEREASTEDCFVPIPVSAALMVSLFIINLSEGESEIIIRKLESSPTGMALKFSLGRLQCKIVGLHKLVGGTEHAAGYCPIWIRSLGPIDFYTVAHREDFPDGPFSVQHVK